MQTSIMITCFVQTITKVDSPIIDSDELIERVRSRRFVPYFRKFREEYFIHRVRHRYHVASITKRGFLSHRKTP